MALMYQRENMVSFEWKRKRWYASKKVNSAVKVRMKLIAGHQLQRRPLMKLGLVLMMNLIGMDISWAL